MTPQVILQYLLFGLFIGGLYGMAAVGLSLIFGVMRVLNVAHGELLMLGGYLTYFLFTLYRVDPFVAILICAPTLFILGAGLNLGLYSRITRLDEESKIKNSLLISFGLALILHNLAIQLWTADERSVTTGYAGLSASVGGLVLPFTRLAGMVAAFLTILGLHLFLQRTYPGKAIRATALDWEAASLAGVNVQAVYLATFALGAALAGVAGTLVSLGYSIHPSIGLAWTLKALVVVVLAGMGSIFGAFAAGLLLGVAESASAIFIEPAYREVIGLVLFLLVLLLRPQGLFGRRA